MTQGKAQPYCRGLSAILEEHCFKWHHSPRFTNTIINIYTNSESGVTLSWHLAYMNANGIVRAWEFLSSNWS